MMPSRPSETQLRVYVWNVDFNDIVRNPGHASLELECDDKKNYLSHWPAVAGREPRQARNEAALSADEIAEKRKYDGCHSLTLSLKQAQEVNACINNIKKSVDSGVFKYHFQNDPEHNNFNCSGMVEKLLNEQNLIPNEYSKLIKEAPGGSVPDRLSEQLKNAWENRDTMESVPLRARL